jgi:hypothetical protein
LMLREYSQDSAKGGRIPEADEENAW